MDSSLSVEAKANCRRSLASLKQSDPAPMAQWLRDHLFGHVMPFWERHAMDDLGGIFTCISDEGEVLSTEKWLWSQWRAVWVFSRIYNHLDRDIRWLKHARHIANFCLKHGWDEKGDGWALLLSQRGEILRGYESVYTDAFAVGGLTELYLAAPDEEIARWARRTADAALKKIAEPHDKIPHFPYPVPAGAKPHGVPMIWSHTLAEFGTVFQAPAYVERANAMSDEIFQHFYRPSRDLIVEFVRQDGGEFPPPHGTAVVPGHVIEDMWFQVDLARGAGGKPARIAQACHLIKRHLEFGWDHQHGGGLRLALDADGREAVAWKFAETKLWWPQTEALYASALAWRETGQADFLEWYERIWHLCLDHYVDWEHGEWRQKLDRSLRPLHGTIALPVKDPFHLSRSLILQIELLEQAAKKGLCA